MNKLLVILLLLLSACSTVPAKKIATADTSTISADTSQLSADDQLIRKGADLVAAGSIKQALENYFNPVAERCEALVKNSNRKLFASRGPVETIYYMALASAAKIDADVLSPTCAQAFYFRGYANLDLGQPEEAMQAIQKAIEWSPVNARYVSELGHLYQLKKDWKNSLEAFEQAEEYAETFSPDAFKNDELTRAKRGVGFNLIELEMLDEAEAKFKECLKLNKADKAALGELEYIKTLRKKAVSK